MNNFKIIYNVKAYLKLIVHAHNTNFMHKYIYSIMIVINNAFIFNPN